MTDQSRRRVMLTAAATLFANFVALLGLTPLYPVVARDLGLGPDGFGLYLAIPGALNVGLQIPIGVVADRVGRRPVMMIGLAFMLSGQVLRSQATNGLIFGLGQVLIGLCGPFIVAAAYAVVADAYRLHGRAQALGALQVAINLGQGVGFLLAAALSPLIGWRGFSLAVAALPLLLLPLIARMPEPPVSGAISASLRSGMSGAIRFLFNPAAGALALVLTLNIGAGMGATYLLPFIAHSHDVGATETGILLIPFLVGAIAGGLPAGRWADRVGVRVPALVALSASALAIALFGVLGFSTLSAVVCYFVVGAGVSATAGLVAVEVVDLANRHGQGTGAALGGMRIGMALGASTAPVLAGVVLVHGGDAAALFALSAAALSAGLLYAAASGVGARHVSAPES